MAANDLIVRVGADLAGFRTDMQSIGPTIRAAAGAAEKEFGGFGTLGSQLQGIGTALTASITLPLAGAGVAATKMFSDFQSAMNQISAVGEVTGSDLNTLKQTAMDLGAQTKFSATEAAQGMAALSAAGLSVSQVMGAIPGVMNLAAAGQMSVGQAAETTAALMGQFGLKASEVSHGIDVMARGAAAGVLSIADMANSFRLVGPVASSAGLSLEQTAAAITLMSNAGLRGEQAGTGLRGVIASLVDPSKEAAAVLDDLGVKTTDNAGKMRPLSDVIQELKDRAITTKDEFVLFGRESVPAFEALKNSGGAALSDMSSKLASADGSAKAMAETLNSGLPGALERMKGSIETAGISLGNVLAPAITALAGLVEQGANKLSEFAQWFKDLPEPVQTAAGGVALFVAALGPLALGVGSAVSALGGLQIGIATISRLLAVDLNGVLPTTVRAFEGLKGGLSLTGAATAAFTTGIVAAIAAIAGFQIKGIIEDLGKLGGDLKDLADQVLESFENELNTAKNALDDLWRSFRDATRPLGDAARAIVDFISDNRTLKTVVNEVRTVWNNATSAFRNVNWWNVLSGPLGLIREKIRDLRQQIQLLTGRYPEMDTAARSAATNLQDYNNRVAASTADVITKLTQKQQKHVDIKPRIDDHANAIVGLNTRYSEASAKLDEIAPKNEVLYAAYQKLQTEARKLIDLKADLIVKMGQMPAAIEAIATNGVNLANKLGEMTTAATATKDSFNTLGQTMPEAFGKGETAIGTLKTEADESFDAIKTKVGAVTAGIAEEWGKSQTATVASAKSAETDIKDVFGNIETTAKDKTSALKTAWSDWASSVKSISGTLSADLTNILFDDDLSWGQKAKKAIGAIGDAFKDAFVDKAKSVIKGFIDDTITDLLSGRGLGGILDTVKNIGEAMKGVFTGASGAVGGAGSAAGAASGAAGSAGSAGSAASGAAGIVNMATGVVSAISGVIGNFQMAKQETTLNAIEESTRYTKIWTGEQSQSILWSTQTTAERLNYVNASLDDLKTYFLDWVAPLKDAIDTHSGYILGQLVDINNSTAWTLVQEQANYTALRDLFAVFYDGFNSLVGQEQANYSALREIAFAVASLGGGGNITVNITGSVGNIAEAQRIGTEIARTAQLRSGRALI